MRGSGPIRPGDDADDLVVEEAYGSLPAAHGGRARVADMRVIETGGDSFGAEREQWDDGNNVVALEPGVVVAYERNTSTNAALRKAGIEVHHDRGLRARSWPRRLATA